MNAPDPQRLGKYEIVRTLGKGAMGVVYLARDPVIERNVAVKTIRKDILDAEAASEVTARFRREAMAAGRLTHPGIVAVYDYGEDESVAYIVMEYAPGENLAGYAASRSLSLPEVSVLMAQLLDALEYAHRAGVVHRDIKPANMLVAERLKITDFGIARIADSSLTHVGAAMGTPAYMAPEQYMGVGVDHRVDVFAAGVVCYELLTGVQPFDGRSLEELSYKICHTEPALATQVRPGLPQSIDAVLGKALAKAKDARFASAGEFARMLVGALASRDSFGGMSDAHGALGIAATISARPQPITSSSLAPASTRDTTNATPDAIARVTQVLATYVGPIARVMVKKATADTPSYSDLCLRLSERLGSEAEKEKFLRELGMR